MGRAGFERAFPPPRGVGWIEELQQYDTTEEGLFDREAEDKADIWNFYWLGWQAQQPRIDALQAEVARLEEAIELAASLVDDP